MLKTLWIIAFFSLAASATQTPVMGALICDPVAQTDAVTFAQQNHFLDNWDFETDPEPPYVAPVGTISCWLPVAVYTITTDLTQTGTAEYVKVAMQNVPSRSTCTVTYYDGTPARAFPADGGGDGYMDLVPGESDFTPFFQDDHSNYFSDQFMILNVGRQPAIAWAGEAQDNKPHVPILSNCHLQY